MSEPAHPVLRQSALRDRLVIDMDTTEEIGRVAQLLVDVKRHQVEGLVCKAGLLGIERTPVAWVQIESIGTDSIVVRQGGNTLSERFDDALSVENLELWTDAGDRIGRIVDYCIDLETGAVTQYLFTAPGWQGLTEGVYSFLPEAIVSAGRKRMMVRHPALQDAPKYQGGLSERAAEVWQQDVTQTQQDLQAAVKGTQAIADQAQQQAQKLTEQAKSKFSQVFGQVKQRTKNLRNQVNDRFADVAANVQAKQEAQDGTRLSGTTIDVDSVEVWPEETPTPQASDSPEPQPSNPTQGEGTGFLKGDKF